MSDPATNPPNAAPSPPLEIHRIGRALLDEFAVGWSRAALDRIMGIFAEDPVFLETPFSESIKGTSAVRRYWSDVPLHQSEVKVTIGEIFGVGPWFSTEFRAQFRRRRTGEWVDARGAIFCETDGTKVTEMRMYWHRNSRRGE